ncbi:MAG TPA: hypothetical protein VHD33_05595 [Legionellaceae bacterium]|nr:hypothetical protein [Legionellaceae bacterium]
MERMPRKKKVNRFFNEYIYRNISEFAGCPVSWACEIESVGPMLGIPNYKKLIIAVALWPVLLPATVATSAISVGVLLPIAGILHGLTLCVVEGADSACTNNLSVHP